RHPYSPPQSQSKRPIDTYDDLTCRAALADAGAGATIWQSLVRGFGGIGPLVAREIAFRATDDSRCKVPADESERDALSRRLANFGQEIIGNVRMGTFTASIAREAPKSATLSGAAEPMGATPEGAIIAFAPYALTHLGLWEPRTSLSQAVADALRQLRAVGALDLAQDQVRRAVAAERSVVERKRDSLRRALDGTATMETIRYKGELLLTHSSRVPRGATSFRADGVDLDLDPRLSAVDNAQAIFRRYRKVKNALRAVPGLLAEADLRLKYLDEVTAMADLADSTEALRQIRAELRPARSNQTTPKRRRVVRPEEGVLRLRTSENLELLVGRSAGQNQAVTFDLGRPDDIWLHARGCPGAHVILRSAGEEPSARSLEEAASVAAYYSASRAATKVSVDWTRRKLVRRLGAPGLVAYAGETTVVVRPSRVPSPDV
ncbi:MAG TPA: NFACT RNA binding domain-containing protein, partial [Chloroflexota bacterium]|nr:NFACT RNA binding domain-containing protein [Chloroflexota bacterium]